MEDQPGGDASGTLVDQTQTRGHEQQQRKFCRSLRRSSLLAKQHLEAGTGWLTHEGGESWPLEVFKS